MTEGGARGDVVQGDGADFQQPCLIGFLLAFSPVVVLPGWVHKANVHELGDILNACYKSLRLVISPFFRLPEMKNVEKSS